MNKQLVGLVVICGIVACLMGLSQASPLLEAPKGAAKVVNPDPLEAVTSEDVPSAHSNDFDMIFPDQESEASMQYQNFDKFYEPLEADAGGEYNMDESQFLRGTRVREPQAPSRDEERIREHVELLDSQEEYRRQRKLTKGSTKSQERDNPWDQFDYDWHNAHTVA